MFHTILLYFIVVTRIFLTCSPEQSKGKMPDTSCREFYRCAAEDFWFCCLFVLTLPLAVQPYAINDITNAIITKTLIRFFINSPIWFG